jgi:hypothetical protein
MPLVLSTSCLAAAGAPAVGSFGFDWLHPKSARCQPISESLQKRFRRCEYRSTGAFGLSDPLHVCRIDERSEYMIFETQAACANNLATMKANAP